jgi:prepilin-type N-terminal cleavage/methylation domain-containing protein
MKKEIKKRWPARTSFVKQKLGGFTLLEVLIVASIFAIVGFAIASFGRDIFWQNYTISKRLVAEGEAKMALAKIVSELRRAQPASTGAYPLEVANSTEITFFSDIDNSGLREKMHYWLEGGTLWRGVTRPTGQPYVYNGDNESVGTAINEVVNTSSTIFSYYDENYDGTASSTPLSPPFDINAVRLVKIDFGNLSSQVMLRNLKDNL